MDEETLIETIRPFPILYNFAHPRNGDAKAKEKIWLQVAETMEESVADCKKVWKNLRESYRRAIKRRTKTTSGQAAITNREWKFEDEMAFLSPNYEEHPTTLSNIAFASEDTEDTNPIRDSSGLEQSFVLEDVGTAALGTANSLRHESASPEPAPVSRRKRKRVEVGEKRTAAAAVMDYLLIANREKEHDEIEQFARCIATKLRKLNPINLAMTMKEIFSMVCDAECWQLAETGGDRSFLIRRPS